jgi:predicted Zn-dependent protease
LKKISWVSHPLLADASEQIEKGQLDAAETNLKKLLQEKPDSLDAYRMLQQIYWRKNDQPAHRDAIQKLLLLELKTEDIEGAAQTYQEFKNAGGEKLPAAAWLELCRKLETLPNVDRALEEYLELAKAYPTERQGLMAQMAVGRLYLKRLNRPAEALQFYQAAKGSPVPHLDWEATIDRGIAEATKALQTQGAPAGSIS